MQWSLILTITYKTNGNKRETFKYLGYQKKGYATTVTKEIQLIL